jgi:hypothetical protein
MSTSAKFFLMAGLLLTTVTMNSQYTYWTYNGEGVNPFGYVTSMKGIVEDTTFRTFGARAENGQRAYEAIHSVNTGNLLSFKSSQYADNAYLGASGFTPLSYHYLADGGYLVARSIVNSFGLGSLKYIRFDSNLDTLWVSQPETYNDPFGESTDNTPLFITPLSDGRYASVLFTRVGNPRYLRFLTHDIETGAILSDHLWDPEEVDADGTITSMAPYGGIQLEDDSLLLWGRYNKDQLPGDRTQVFLAKFSVDGNLGSYNLTQFDDPTPAFDSNGVIIPRDDELLLFYLDGQAIFENTFTYPNQSVFKVDRYSKSDLQLINGVFVTTPEFNDQWLMAASIIECLPSSDGGFIVTSLACPENFNCDYFVLKLNSNFELEWKTTLLTNNDSWVSMILECPDRDIIVGGGRLEFPVNDVQRDHFIKLDACGYMVPSDCPEFVSVADGEIRQEGFRLWPNPGTGAVDAIVPFNARQLQVVEASGRCVYTEDLYYPRQTWQLTHLPNGVYTFIVHTEDGGKHHQRWVKK